MPPDPSAAAWTRNFGLAIVAIVFGGYGLFWFPIPFVLFSSLPYDEVRAGGVDASEYLRFGLSGGPLILGLIGMNPSWSAPVEFAYGPILVLAKLSKPVFIATVLVGGLVAIASVLANVSAVRPAVLGRPTVIEGARVMAWFAAAVALAIMLALQALLTLQFGIWILAGACLLVFCGASLWFTFKPEKKRGK